MDYWLSSLAKSEDGVTYWKATNEPLEYTNFASSRPLDNNACMSLDHQTLAWKPVLFCQYKFKYTLCGKGKLNMNLPLGKYDIRADRVLTRWSVDSKRSINLNGYT